MTQKQTKISTYISKAGDSVAAKKIEQIVKEGWKISCVTPNGSVMITTFCR